MFEASYYARLLIRGQIIIAPTETCYAFAANALEPAAVETIQHLKARDGHPIGLLVKDAAMACRLARVEPFYHDLMAEFWPGPLTMALPTDYPFPSQLNQGVSTIAMRQSPHPFWRDLFELIDFPVTATSVNKHGLNEIYDLRELARQFVKDELNAVALIVDNGQLPRALPSTVIDCQSKTPALIRSGPVAWSLIETRFNEMKNE